MKYQAVVIGTGFGGSPVACRLAQAGVKTLVLERGKKLYPKDFVQSFSLVNLSKYYESFVSSDFAAVFRVSNVMGGGTVTFDGGCLRSPSEVFDFRDKSGYRVWPELINREVMDPYYEKIEQMLRVRQLSWDEIPKTGGLFAKMLDNLGLTCDRACFNYGKCHQCGFCETGGCSFGVKVNAMMTYLLEAEKKGADILAEANAEKIMPLSGGGYRIVYTQNISSGKTTKEVDTDFVFVAGSALSSPRIFFQSKKYFKKISPQIGKNLNTNGDLSFGIELPEPIEDYYVYKGTPNAGVITYAWWDEHKITIHPGSAPPAIFAATEAHTDRSNEFVQRGWGLKSKYYLESIYPHKIIPALNIGLVDGESEVEWDDDKLIVNHKKTPNFLKYIDRVESVLLDFTRRNDAKLIYYNNRYKFEHGNAHHLSTMRMGDDPKKSVCDAYGEVRGYPGLYVVDGGSIPGGTGVNPALTIGANAERIVDQVINNKI